MTQHTLTPLTCLTCRSFRRMTADDIMVMTSHGRQARQGGSQGQGDERRVHDMAGERLFMGIDVSTTAVKALLIDGSGAVVGQASAPLTLSTPLPLWAEQHPADWWAGAVTSIRSALTAANVSGDAVAAIGLTGQMHGLVALDAHGQVVRPAILWNDQRTAKQCDEIRQRVGRERLIQITGNDALPGFTAPKILWVAEHEPEVYARMRHILLPKDYLRFRLTG